MSIFKNIIKQKNLDIEELRLFSQVSVDGLRQATLAPKRLDAYIAISSILGKATSLDSPDAVAIAKKQADDISSYASKELSQGAIYIYSLCTVRLWSIIEALVDELVAHAIRNPNTKADRALLLRLKGPLLEFEEASEEDRSNFLMELLKQQVDAALKKGIGKFESVLNPVGLGGGIHDTARRALLER